MKSNKAQVFVGDEKDIMKTIKILTLFLVLGFFTLFGYANLRRQSLIETLKPVALTSMKIDGYMDSQERLALEKKVSMTPGITACTLGKAGDIASIIYYPEQINVETLARLLSNDGKLKISLINLEKSGVCPVHQLNSSFNELITLLDIRNN